jgi:hypothetical protein
LWRAKRAPAGWRVEACPVTQKGAMGRKPVPWMLTYPEHQKDDEDR